MVRGLGVEHKSLLVPNVTEGSYAIRYEHADYLIKDFNISVGYGLPTTFSEAMIKKVYTILLEKQSDYPSLLADNTVMQLRDDFSYGFVVRNTGNTPFSVGISVQVDGIEIYSDTTSVLDPAGFYGYRRSSTTDDLSVGNHTVHVIATITGTTITEELTQTLTVQEWTTDITFVATSPGISDLHGVEVFIDDTSMGTT